MLYQILTLVLDMVAGLFTGACLLRWYMQSQRIAFNNPVGQLVFGLSDWLVMPLRRVVPPMVRSNLSGLLAALLLQLAQYLLLWLLLPWHLAANLAALVIFSLRGQGKTIVRAKWQALQGLGHAWRQRRSIQHQRIASVRSIWAALDKRLWPKQRD